LHWEPSRCRIYFWRTEYLKDVPPRRSTNSVGTGDEASLGSASTVVKTAEDASPSTKEGFGVGPGERERIDDTDEIAASTTCWCRGVVAGSGAASSGGAVGEDEVAKVLDRERNVDVAAN
jgi:hypothetical protein